MNGGTSLAGARRGELARRDLAELGDARLGCADDEDLAADLHEVDRAARIERELADELDRPARPADAEAPRAVEDDERETAHRQQT